MKKFYIGVGILVLAFLLMTTALAFSHILQNLRLNALSFTQPTSALVIAAPMTSADEAAMTSPDKTGVHLEEFVQPAHVCNKEGLPETITDF